MEEQKAPEVLNISVGENIKSGESMGPGRQIFQNPTNNPNIAGIAKVRDLASYQKIGELAFKLHKETNKPVIITVDTR